MAIAYIALGSNLGDRYATLSAAVRRLRAEPGLRLIASSAFYETAPVNCPPGSGEFLNAVVAVETERSPEDLLQLLLCIERQFGRIRSEPNSPRTLDLDILLYDDRVINSPELTIPHPRMHERAFVLVPLAEIAPDAVHPTLGKTVRELLGAVTKNDVRPAPTPRIANPPLAGLRALVTGSSSGIGASIAFEFELHGAEVIRHGRRERLDANERFVSADLRDPAQVDRLANEAWNAFGALDV